MATRTTATRKTTAKRKTARASPAKKSSAKTSSAKKSAAKKSSAKSAARKSARRSGTSLSPGDSVTWGTSQGRTEGRVVKKQTTPTRIKTHQVKASEDNPEYIVESAKSGKRAAHKPGELKKKG